MKADASGGGSAAGELHARILVPGRNCQRIETARRGALIVDAADYYQLLESLFAKASRSILIVGWDFDAGIKLRPRDPDSPVLGDVLRATVEANPDLEVRILVWSLSTLHGPGATVPMILGEPWRDHPRIHFRLDTNHPLYGAHHQKIVCIDDSIAFCGGIDLTVERWDTNRHAEDDPCRKCPDGTPYGPVHDMQMALDGDAARAIADIARARWREGVGETLPEGVGEDIWPEGLEPAFREMPVGIARTMPGTGENRPVREVAALTDDALRAARRTVYIEQQYLTAKRVRRVLGELLRRDDPPEIVILVTRASRGFVEQFVMGANRDRLVRRLKKRDRHDRLHVYYPVSPGCDGECEILIHAKLMIVDDTFFRVGSANLNNRSMGLDSECDIAIEAHDGTERETIARLRASLLGEHLDADTDTVLAAIEREGSIAGAIETLAAKPRRLRDLLPEIGKGARRSIPGTGLLDPEKPFAPFEFFRRRRARRRVQAASSA